MALNQQQQAALLEILNSDLFKRAEEEVRALASPSLTGLLAPEAGMALAVERGVANAFRDLRRLTNPTATITPVGTQRNLRK